MIEAGIEDGRRPGHCGGHSSRSAKLLPMRRFVCCLLTILCCLTSCQKNTSAPPKKKVTIHTTIIPEDMSKEKVKDVIPMHVPVLERASLGSTLGPDGNVSVSQS